MGRSLCISVTYLLGRYHGQTDNARAPEWPPSPLRFFQALVAAAHAGRGSSPLPDDVEAALRWLERRDPPLILAPPSHDAAPYALSVPNNDLDKPARAWAAGREPGENEQPAKLRTIKTVRPSTLDAGENGDGGDTVHFLWPVFDADWLNAEPHCRAIAVLARRVIALGWGLDLVAACARVLDGAQAAALSGTRWRPVERMLDPRSRRPVPVEGSLDALRRRHAEFLNRIQLDTKGRPSVYNHVRPITERSDKWQPVAYLPHTRVPPRPFAAFALRPVEPGARSPWRAFSQDRAVCLAAMLRHAACEAAKADLDVDLAGHPRPGAWRTREWAEQFVAGHGPRKENGRFIDDNWPRFSYLPLPSIGHRRADGLIRRLLIAEPHDGAGHHAQWAATRLAGANLVDEQTGEIVAMLERLDPRDGADRVLPLYLGRARKWVTATPIVLPGYDGLKLDKAARLFSRACDQAGLPPGSVESFEFVGPPAHAGSAGRFFVPKYLRGWPLRWAVVRFREEVTGPVALGAGRHCGLGVLSVNSLRA